MSRQIKYNMSNVESGTQSKPSWKPSLNNTVETQNPQRLFFKHSVRLFFWEKQAHSLFLAPQLLPLIMSHYDSNLRYSSFINLLCFLAVSYMHPSRRHRQACAVIAKANNELIQTGGLSIMAKLIIHIHRLLELEIRACWESLSRFKALAKLHSNRFLQAHWFNISSAGWKFTFNRQKYRLHIFVLGWIKLNSLQAAETSKLQRAVRPNLWRNACWSIYFKKTSW